MPDIKSEFRLFSKRDFFSTSLYEQYPLGSRDGLKDLSIFGIAKGDKLVSICCYHPTGKKSAAIDYIWSIKSPFVLRSFLKEFYITPGRFMQEKLIRDGYRECIWDKLKPLGSRSLDRLEKEGLILKNPHFSKHGGFGGAKVKRSWVSIAKSRKKILR